MIVIVKVRPEERGEFLDAMRSLQKDRLAEQGTIGSQVYGDGGDSTGFRFTMSGRRMKISEIFHQRGFQNLARSIGNPAHGSRGQIRPASERRR
jgi:hypothetical protein